jgi:hypothetical protein
MGISKYTLYKYVKVSGAWRCRKAAYHGNAKIKPDIVFVDAKRKLEEKHPEGRYYMSHNGGWIDPGTDALEAQRKRKQRLALDEFNRFSGKASTQSSLALPDSPGRITLAAAAEKYFANCEAHGLDPETIRRTGSARAACTSPAGMRTMPRASVNHKSPLLDSTKPVTIVACSGCKNEKT